MAVAGKGAVSAAVKPIFSRDLGEAKRRVRELYRAWYREVPNAVHLYQLDITVKQGRNKVREMFMRNAHVRDPRVIDMLVIKGKMDLQETIQVWKQRTHIMRTGLKKEHWKDQERQWPKAVTRVWQFRKQEQGRV
ncbi:NADH dehydrogenase [ubiquinone] 1 alpha subcomplex subunit 6 [Patagioenas fasciata monilis]|uniref:NADH dehydrogenase [ubiquinone] 1 alpha subcomplex subunit 6 n=1 Tax=Patagioenas fasciata monilis TaxID=372326 RepID=A0A1V4JAC2_PATFA|nr:NADH dehydrogenase [ubiquinone] 1 alpha subcomplex subunit 6 [Patagioenas fasciata monilis]